MSVVVNLGAYRSKGVLTLFRELLVAASKGKIAGARVLLEYKDGSRKTCAAGKDISSEDCSEASPCKQRAGQ